MATYKLQIAKPCHESWEEMSPTERGAFCMHCLKDVVDYTGITTNELRDYLNQNKALSCGRFTQAQLDAVYVVNNNKPTKKWIHKGWMAAFVSLIISVFNTKAEAKNSSPEIEWVDDAATDYLLPVVVDEPTDTGDIILTGVVVDEKGEGLPFVPIVLDENLKIFGHADVDGKFSIKVPEELRNKKLTLTFKMVGYAVTTIDLGRVTESPKPISVVLNATIKGNFTCITIEIPDINAKAQADRFYFGVR